MVMADGFWPRLYFRQGLTQAVDYGKIPNMAGVFPEFLPPNFKLLADESGEQQGRGAELLGRLRHHRQHLAGRRRRHRLDRPAAQREVCRPFLDQLALRGEHRADGHSRGDQAGHHRRRAADGKPFNPYNLTDEELEETKKLLIEQKKLLLTRYQDYDALDRLMRGGVGLGGAGILRDLPAPDRAAEGRQARLRRPARAEAEGRRPRLGRHLDDQRGCGLRARRAWPTPG